MAVAHVGEVKAPIVWYSLIAITLAYLFWSALAAFALQACFHPRHFNYIPEGLLACAAFLIIIVQTRAPLTTLMAGDRLTVQRIVGKSTVGLNDIVSVKRVTLALRFSCLKTTDSEGHSVFIQLGMVAKENRELLGSYLDQVLNPHLQSVRWVQLWNVWNKRPTKTVRRVTTTRHIAHDRPDGK